MCCFNKVNLDNVKITVYDGYYEKYKCPNCKLYTADYLDEEVSDTITCAECSYAFEVCPANVYNYLTEVRECYFVYKVGQEHNIYCWCKNKTIISWDEFKKRL